IITYGTGTKSGADYTYQNVAAAQNSSPECRVFHKGKELGSFRLLVPGEHNKLNALSAIAVGMELGMKFEKIAHALSSFKGVDRRFQIIAEERGIVVVDDYAHHPTEVVATLKAARQYLADHKRSGGRVVAVFQPHQPGRLRDLWEEFCAAFVDGDLILL